MFKRNAKIWFSALFIAIIVLPLAFINLKPHQRSSAENRELTQKAVLYNDDGTLNENYFSDFESWFNDNIGFRSRMVVQNAKIQFYLFGQLSDNEDYYLGPNGALNYATNAIINDYQHFDLKTQDQLNQITDSFQYIKDYVEDQGIQFYYFQCWDKQSIYPEYFPAHVKQYGSESKTDQFLTAIKEKTDVDVVDPKPALIEGKSQYDTYSYWGDATHWSRRGAFIGYTELMNEIDRRNSGKYKILTEADYDLSLTDQGATIFGGIHKVDMLENFQLKDPKAYTTGEEPLYTSRWQDSSKAVYQNDTVDNDDTVLILGDSYFNSFIFDDLAESFHRTVLLWGDMSQYMMEMINYYQPSIVICENAERCDRTGGIIAAASRIRSHQYSSGDPITFYGENANAGDYVTSGIGEIGAENTWTSANEVVIPLIGNNLPEKLHGELTIDGVQGDSQGVQILVNDGIAWEGSADGPTVIRFDFDNPGTVVTDVKIELPDAVQQNDGNLKALQLKKFIITGSSVSK